MPRLLIKFTNQQNQIFSFENTILIGRGENCSLVLPNNSVSREHATIHLESEEVFIEDLGSQNGLLLNGDKLNSREKRSLSSRSEIQIGNFTLIFLTDSKEDNFYRGRSILYLPQYDPQVLNENTDSTFKMSAKEASSMLRKKSLLNNACIIDDIGKKLYPETNEITFGGKGALIKVKGWFTGGVVATITWEENRHILTKKSVFFVVVKVNGKNVTKHTLTVNDKINIGNSSFQYVLDTST